MIDKGPLIIVANHPNTLMDPLVVASILKQRTGFVAKSLIFANAVSSWILTKLHVIPIFRTQDAAPGEKVDNSKSFERCIEYLDRKGSILIFPEGVSVIEMKLRPIKTGTARIALAFENQHHFEGGLRIQAVGLNYWDASRFGTRLNINVGKAIEVKKYKESYASDNFEAARLLSEEIKEALEAVMVITETDDDEALIKRVRVFYEDYLRDQHILRGDNQDFILTQELGKALMTLKKSHPDLVQEVRTLCDNYFKELDEQQMRVGFFRSKPKRFTFIMAFLLNLIYLVATLPIYLFGLLTSYLPYKLPYPIANAIVKEVQYRSGIMLLGGVLLFPICYALETWLFRTYIADHNWQAWLFLCTLPLASILTLRWYKIQKITRSLWKYYQLTSKKSDAVLDLHKDRLRLMELLEQARAIVTQS